MKQLYASEIVVVALIVSGCNSAEMVEFVEEALDYEARMAAIAGIRSIPDPVPLVQVASGGAVFAFAVGTGLVQAKEPNLKWQVLSKGIDDRLLIHLVVDPRDERKLYAITLERNSNQQEILASADGGVSWSPLGSGAKTQ